LASSALIGFGVSNERRFPGAGKTDRVIGLPIEAHRRSPALIGGKKILLWSIHDQRSPGQRLKCNRPEPQVLTYFLYKPIIPGMETSSPPPQAVDLSTPLYYQLVYTLTDLLPPPLDDTQEGLRARHLAAIAKVAALRPVNANEIDLAAQCIAARARAEDVLRLLRRHADDIGLVMRLNPQYGSMVRTSLSVQARLMRVQAVRQKREAIEGAATEDARVQHIAERSMLRVVIPAAAPQQAAAPGGVSPAWFGAMPVETPAACGTQRIAGNVPDNGTNSHDVAFETWMSAMPWNGVSSGSGKTGPRDVAHELLARSRLAGREAPANGRESPGRAP